MFIYIHPKDLYLYLQGEKINMKNNKKGFTLMEMLIVVAIIAVLVAIAIPVLNSTLEKSREAADAANLRAAYAEVMINALEDPDGTVAPIDVDATQTIDGWDNKTIESIGGIKLPEFVAGKTTKWTVAYDANNSTCTITPDAVQ